LDLLRPRGAAFAAAAAATCRCVLLASRVGVERDFTAAATVAASEIDDTKVAIDKW